MARRVWQDLLAAGLGCGLHTIERLMTRNALCARPRRRRLPGDTGVRPAHELAVNLLDRQFEAGEPNRKWVADFTYIWTAEVWLYIAGGLDLFLSRGRPREVLHHSDRGSQYTSEQCRRLMAEHAIQYSLSRSGNVWDNAAMESFFSSLKTERTARRDYRTRNDARTDVFDYIERFYYPRRRHLTLEYLSPVAYEERMQ